jgi:hypothetical protein
MTKKEQSPYKDSIWDMDTRYEIGEVDFDEETKKLIGRLMSVDSAKKNTPPIPIRGLLKIHEEWNKISDEEVIDRTKVENFLTATKEIRGAGFLSLVCILAVLSEGEYPPCDRKFSAGLLKKQKITEDEEHILLKTSSVAKFAEVYVDKVLPAWQESRENFLTPKEADEFWGSGGKEV